MVCIDCKKDVKLACKNRCNACYKKYNSKKNQDASPRKKCECSPECQEIIPSVTTYGIPMRYKKGHGKDRDGRKVNSCGYVEFHSIKHFNFKKTTEYREHRYVYEKHNQCCLLDWVDIHHIDGDKTNNEISNLQPLTRSKHRSITLRDMSGRSCSNCNSKLTILFKDNNRPHWYFDKKGGYLCRKCYNKLKRLNKI